MAERLAAAGRLRGRPIPGHPIALVCVRKVLNFHPPLSTCPPPLVRRGGVVAVPAAEALKLTKFRILGRHRRCLCCIQATALLEKLFSREPICARYTVSSSSQPPDRLDLPLTDALFLAAGARSATRPATRAPAPTRRSASPARRAATSCPGRACGAAPRAGTRTSTPRSARPARSAARSAPTRAASCARRAGCSGRRAAAAARAPAAARTVSLSLHAALS